MAIKKTHVIVSVSKWHIDNVRYRRHHLADFLCRQEDTEKVIWLSVIDADPRTPSSYLDAIKDLKSSHTSIKNKLSTISLPDLIPGKFQSMDKIFVGRYLAALKGEVNSCAGEKVLWFTVPVLPFLMTLLAWDAIIYDCSDLWMAHRSDKPSYSSSYVRNKEKRAEELIARESDLIFASSDYLADHIEEKMKRQVFVVENGVDFKDFDKKTIIDEDLMKGIARPRLGFVGSLKPKIDIDLLIGLADFNEKWNVVLVGLGPKRKNHQFEELIKRNNVFWLGGVEPKRVAQYLYNLDLALLPYKEIDYNKGVFPLKFYEYFAAGLAVVGCGLPSTIKYEKRGIYKHVNRDSFNDACSEAMSWNRFDFYQERVAFAEKADWEDKFKLMYDKICELL